MQNMPMTTDQALAISKALREQAVGAGEVAASMGSGAASDWAGIMSLLGNLGMPASRISGDNSFGEAYDQSAMPHAEEMMYIPRTEAGQQQMGAIGNALRHVAEPIAGAYNAAVTQPMERMGGESGAKAAAALGIGLMGAMDVVPGGSGVKAASRADEVARIAKAAEKSRALRGPAITLNKPPLNRPDITAPPELKVKRGKADAKGQYYGAPPGINSPQKLGALTAKMKNMATEGAEYRLWYDRSRQSADELTAGDIGMRDRILRTQALTSKGAKVSGNTTMAAKGYNQGLQGEKGFAGRFPTETGERIDEMWRKGETGEELSQAGPKIDPFDEALSSDMGVGASRPTNDIQMARAYGYSGPEEDLFTGAPGIARHRFMDAHNAALVKQANKEKWGGYDDWNSERIQAAIWISQKSRAEEVSLAEAGKAYPDFLEGTQAQINVESRPSNELHHMDTVFDDPELSQYYHDMQNDVLLDEAGRSKLALEAGALTSPSVDGPGYWKGDTNPATAHRISTGTAGEHAPESQQLLNMDESSERLVNSIAAAEGLLRGQAGVGVYKPGAAAMPLRNNAVVSLGRTVTPDEMTAVGARLDNLAAELKDIAPDVDVNGAYAFPRHTDSGFSIGFGFKDVADRGKAVTAMQKAIQKILKQELGAKAKFGSGGNLIGDGDEFKPSALLQELDEGSPLTTQRLNQSMKRHAADLEAIDDLFEQNIADAGQRHKYMKLTREALAAGGVARVRQLVKRGILPMLVLGVVGLPDPDDTLPTAGEGEI